MIIHFINFHIYFNAIYCSKLSLKIKLFLTVCIQIMDGMRIDPNASFTPPLLERSLHCNDNSLRKIIIKISNIIELYSLKLKLILSVSFLMLAVRFIEEGILLYMLIEYQ